MSNKSEKINCGVVVVSPSTLRLNDHLEKMGESYKVYIKHHHHQCDALREWTTQQALR